ncbi:MAG: ribonuclease [Naasia sp.]|uniref:ribonuclease HII n=1 Tax=Naasia sp. TaxID=2546198 RepID=UPI0026359BF9|nr:ribonuclease HII [Naasia sp.]MCU1571160.1 ribonuclease [Naasia sp.]
MAERAAAAPPQARPKSSAAPNLRRERALVEEGARWVIGCDEVGRGAIAGPVAVGACVVDLARRVPRGLRDSKLLPEKRREELEPLVDRWAVFSAVGMATNDEVDALGLTAALGLAGARAVLGLFDAGFGEDEAADSVILLDGKHDYLAAGFTRIGLTRGPRVSMRIKADLTCASVSGASVLAKVRRDRLMIDSHEEHPRYGWVSNKGYGSSSHWSAIDEWGPTPLHRHTWLRTPSLFDLDGAEDDERRYPEQGFAESSGQPESEDQSLLA